MPRKSRADGVWRAPATVLPSGESAGARPPYGRLWPRTRGGAGPHPGDQVAGGVCMIRIKKILYPTDFSSYSNQAYFHAIAPAENHAASLTVLFAYSSDGPTPGSVGNEAADRHYWKNQLEQIRPVDPGISVRHVFLEGDPANEIVRYGRDAG